jgi:hypothetical protein
MNQSADSAAPLLGYPIQDVSEPCEQLKQGADSPSNPALTCWIGCRAKYGGGSIHDLDRYASISSSPWADLGLSAFAAFLNVTLT